MMMAHDSSQPATKADIAFLLTSMQKTFHDFENRFATKEELQNMCEEFMRHIDVRFEEWRHDFLIYPEIIKDHGKRISRLETHARFR